MSRLPDGPSLAGSRAAFSEAEEGIRLRIWTEEEFLAREEDYRGLLARSGADPLFMSWEWLTTWWELHKEPFGLSLKVFSAEAEDGRVLGLAPMTVRPVRHRGGVLGTRLEPLGNLVREKGAALTEHVTFLVDRCRMPEVAELLARSVFREPCWDDLCLSFVPVEGDTWRSVVEVEARSSSAYVRPPDYLTAYRLDLKDGFPAFLDALGAKTRLRLYNGRRRLAKIGSVEFVVASSGNFEECLAVLDRLHSERWGVSALSGLRGRLYRTLAQEGLVDGSLSLSYLAAGGRSLAAALNLRTGDCEYGIQMGLSGDAPGNVSPGYLHLGFMIERCCDDGIRYFDFLAGKGGEGDYRKHFGGAVSEVGAVHIVRSRRIATLYRSVDLSRGLRDWITGALKPPRGRSDAPVRDAG